MNIIKAIFLSISLTFLLTGCGVGSLVAMPFKVTGAVVNVVTPDVVGDSIAGVGETADAIIPF